MRSVHPAGGLLSDGDPAPPAARDFNAMVSKEWDDASLSGPAPREGKDVEPTALSGREHGPDSLVVINGPGGFPLLGAVAIGHRTKNPRTGVGDFAMPRADGDRGGELAVGFAAEEFLAEAAIPRTELGETVQSRIRPDRAGWGLSASLFSGLGLATIFTLNALLSQPIAGFDYLTNRLDAARRLQWSRKYRLRKPRSER
jgi:hypothetical protein